jgi:hypothetical protein
LIITIIIKNNGIQTILISQKKKRKKKRVSLGDYFLLRLVGFCSRSRRSRSRSRSHCRSRSGSWASSSSSGFCPFLAKKFLLVRAQLLPLFFLKDRCRISRLKNSNINKIGKKLHPAISFLKNNFHCHFRCY